MSLKFALHRQMVNRPEGIVRHRMIRGEPVWQAGGFTAGLGRRSLRRALRAG